jgi:hypothetical protein
MIDFWDSGLAGRYQEVLLEGRVWVGLPGTVLRFRGRRETTVGDQASDLNRMAPAVTGGWIVGHHHGVIHRGTCLKCGRCS